MRRALFPATAAAAALVAAAAGPTLAAHAAGPSPRRAAAATSLPYGSIVVAGAHAVYVFAPGSNGNVAPVRTITGAATKFSQLGSLDVDSQGRIWTADHETSTISAFSPTAHGNATPLRSFTENNSNDEKPLGVAVTNDDKHVWIGNDGSSVVSSYATSSSGTATASQRIIGADTGIGHSHDVALSPDGVYLFQSDGGTATVHEYATNGPEDQAPIRSIVLGASDAHFNEGVAVDLAGHVWVSDDKADALYEFGKSDTVPIRTITGSQTGLVAPEGIAFDAKGRLWVAVGGGGATGVAGIEAFSPTADGNVKPLVRITGSATTLPFLEDVAVYGAAPGRPATVKATARKHAIRVTWQAPARTRGGVIGYTVERRKGNGKWHAVATQSSRVYADRHATSGHRYRYAVTAYNEIGASGSSKSAAVKAR